MWKYYATNDHVFWDANSIDKPSADYINNMNWKEVQLNINSIDQFNVTCQSSSKFSMIKLVNEENNEVLFYVLKKINKYTKESYNLMYELDVWTSYNLELLDKDDEILVDVHQEYDDDKCLEFNNVELENANLSYEHYTFLDKKHKSTVSGNKIKFENEELKASLDYDNKDNVVNGCYCLVLNDVYNKNNLYTPYTYIPILSTYGQINVNNETEYEIVKVECKFNSRNVGLQNFAFWGWNVNVPAYTDQWGKQFYKKDIEIYKEKLANGFNCNVNFFITDDSGVRWTKSLDTYLAKSSIENWGFAAHYSGFGDYFQVRGPSTESINFNFSMKPSDKTKCYVEFKYYKRKPLKDEKVNNSYDEINKLAEGNSKVMGVFITPNVLNLSETWEVTQINNKKFLTYNIYQQGSNITPVKFDLVASSSLNNKLEFNHELPLFKYVYKFYDFNYLNNQFDFSKYILKDKLFLFDHINFTNSFNVSYSHDLIPLDNQILTLPNQQPFFIDTYKNFVQANMNSVNTGYNIAKQNSILSGVSFGWKSLQNLSNGSLDLGRFSTGVASNVLGMNQYKQSIIASYKDKDSQLGNKLLFSSTQDTIFNKHLNSVNEQFDSIYFKSLSTDSIMQINNYLLLNGVYNPKYFKLNELPKTTQHLGFYYAKLNPTNFNQVFSKYINQPLDLKNQILNNMLEFRVWDKIPSLE